MNRIRHIGLTLVAVLAFFGVVIAQQPAVIGQSKSLPARILDHLRTFVSGSPPEERPSLEEILRRYDAVVDIARETEASGPRQSKAKAKQPRPTRKDASRPQPSAAPPPLVHDDDTLRTIIKELRAIIARLEGVVDER
jgi:hypothetical protein